MVHLFLITCVIADNAEFYCKRGLPFVMGTTGGDRDRLFKTVNESGVYAVIAPQMGKQVIQMFLKLLYKKTNRCYIRNNHNRLSDVS